MRKLVVDENNIVTNIIIDENNEVTEMPGFKLIVHEDEDVTLGDTVNDDGTLRTRRADFFQATEEDRLAMIAEDVATGRLLINEVGELTLPNGMVVGLAGSCCNQGSVA